MLAPPSARSGSLRPGQYSPSAVALLRAYSPLAACRGRRGAWSRPRGLAGGLPRGDKRALRGADPTPSGSSRWTRCASHCVRFARPLRDDLQRTYLRDSGGTAYLHKQTRCNYVVLSGSWRLAESDFSARGACDSSRAYLCAFRSARGLPPGQCERVFASCGSANAVPGGPPSAPEMASAWGLRASRTSGLRWVLRGVREQRGVWLDGGHPATRRRQAPPGRTAISGPLSLAARGLAVPRGAGRGGAGAALDGRETR